MISKLFQVIITVNAARDETDHDVDMVRDQSQLLSDYTFKLSREHKADDIEECFRPACAGWGHTIIFTVDNIGDAYILENRVKYFIYDRCNHFKNSITTIPQTLSGLYGRFFIA